MIDAVVIEGVRFPVAYNGYTYSRNKIWSKNTGRNDYGEMVGTIVTIKDKVELQLPPLTGEQALLLDNVVSDIDNPYPTAQYLQLLSRQATENTQAMKHTTECTRLICLTSLIWHFLAQIKLFLMRYAVS